MLKNARSFLILRMNLVMVALKTGEKAVIITTEVVSVATEVAMETTEVEEADTRTTEEVADIVAEEEATIMVMDMETEVAMIMVMAMETEVVAAEEAGEETTEMTTIEMKAPTGAEVEIETEATVVVVATNQEVAEELTEAITDIHNECNAQNNRNKVLD